MKTRIATLMLMLGIFFASTAFANDPVPATKAVSRSVAKYLKKNLTYPEFAIEEKSECCVFVSLVIKDDGTFDVNGSNSIDKRMKEFVIKEIESLQKEEFSQYAGQRVLLKITFDLLLV
ncbi:MAG: hypothetical protein GXO86_05980 [Chlorobi bacterium]|nr:hypothetical protein [Chlorobiota bacterium]